MSEPLNALPVCPQCHAEVGAARQSCWLCGANLSGGGVDWRTAVPKLPRSAEQERIERRVRQRYFQFSLGALLLLVTVISVCLGIGVHAPGLGLLCAVFAIPSLVHTVRVAARQKDEDLPLSTGEYVATFGYSLITIILAAVAAGCVAFVAFWLLVFAVCGGGTFLLANTAGVPMAGVIVFTGLVAATVAILVAPLQAFSYLLKSLWGKNGRK